MWIPPKTDWVYDDDFNLYPDYFRIKNNILELQRLTSQMYKPFVIVDMKDYGIGESEFVRFEDFFNHVEENIDVLKKGGFSNPAIPATRTWVANKAAWTWHDLNRVEGSLLMMYNDLLSQTYNQKTMAFLLGGEDFE